jgi:GntR family transcriptional regulator/MocR family aminotransferase
MPKIGSIQRICEVLRLKIDAGELSPGQKLPSTRALASDLGVSRSTVVSVYEQLASEGYIETAPGSRARVALNFVLSARVHRPSLQTKQGEQRKLSAFGRRTAALHLPAQPEIKPGEINFLYGAIADEDFPKLMWRKLYNQVLMKRQAHLYYAAPEGAVELRSELQGYLLRARGLSCTKEQIIIVQGAQQGIDLCARLLVDPGSDVLLEEPCYLRARRAFESIGADVTPIPVDDHGLMTSLLPNAKEALAYVTPSHQFPLGSVMSIGRRRELLAWAAKNRCWIIEDDYDSEFRYGLKPTQTLHSLDVDGSVIYIGTFSKTLSPQLRLGYLVLPPDLVKVFRQAKQLIDRHAPCPEQLVIANLIQSGAYERHIRRVRRANETKRTVLIEAIHKLLPTHVLIEGTASGLHIVVWLEDLQINHEPPLIACARALGLGIWSITPLYSAGNKFRRKHCAGLVMGYAGLTPADIIKGVERLAKAVQQTHSRAVGNKVSSPRRSKPA